MFEEKTYCILIVTWVLLREINKYELETCYGRTAAQNYSYSLLLRVLVFSTLILNSK